MRHSLLFETSTKTGLLALAANREITWSQTFPLGQSRAVPLLPLLEKILQEKKLAPQDIDLVIVGIGPGSYTGIRLGVAAAKCLAYALGRPLVGVSSLLAFVPKKEEVPYWALLDAKQGGVYAMKGLKRGGKIDVLQSPKLLSIEEVLEELESTPYVVSDHPALLKKRIASRAVEWEEQGPNPHPLFQAGWDKEAQGDVCWDGDLSILYLRKTQAEIEREGE